MTGRINYQAFANYMNDQKIMDGVDNHPYCNSQKLMNYFNFLKFIIFLFCFNFSKSLSFDTEYIFFGVQYNNRIILNAYL